jgi:Fe-S-cluster containining protein
MSLNQKITALNHIYRLYDNFTGGQNIVCQKYCAKCCTPDVTMTTLEGYLIADYMISNAQADLFENVKAKISKTRFKPQITTNRLADLCMKGDDPPEEEKIRSDKSCPVLKDDLCQIYEVRPFGCRCFISKHDCGKAGYAEVDSYIMTLNTLFIQFVEHIDAIGFSGNFADVLLLMASNENRGRYKMNALNHPGAGFVHNLMIKVLIVPPEHRMKIKPVLEALLSIKEL